MNTDGIVYRLGGSGRTDVAGVRETIAEAWADMHHSGTVAHYLAISAGIDVAIFPWAVHEAVEVTPVATAEADGTLLAVTGLLRAMAPEEWRNVWTQVLWPRVTKRFGNQVLIPVESNP